MRINSKQKWIKIGARIFLCIFALCCLLDMLTFPTPAEIDPFYSRSINSYSERGNIYADQDTLLMCPGWIQDCITQYQNGWLKNVYFHRKMYDPDGFILTDGFLVYSTRGDSQKLRVHASKSVHEYAVDFQTRIIDGLGDTLYYYTELEASADVYALHLHSGERSKLFDVDQVIATYRGGIIYRKDGKLWEWLIAAPTDHRVILDKPITWEHGIVVSPDSPIVIGSIDLAYLFTTEYIYLICGEIIYRYSFETEKAEPIYTCNAQSRAFFALCASDDALYLSVHETDSAGWPKTNREIERTFVYDEANKGWRKISNQKYYFLEQVNEDYLYAQTLGGKIESLKLD